MFPGCGRIGNKIESACNENINKYVYISNGYGLLGRSTIDIHTIVAVWHNYVNEICHRRLHRAWTWRSIMWKSYYLIASNQLSCAWAVIDSPTACPSKKSVNNLHSLCDCLFIDVWRSAEATHLFIYT